MPQSITVEAVRGGMPEPEADKYTVITDYLRDSMDCMNMQCIALKVEKAIRRFTDTAIAEILMKEGNELWRVVPKECRLPDFFVYQPDLKGIAEEVVRTGQVISYPLSEYVDKKTIKEIRAIGGKSLLGLPVCLKNETIAVMVISLKEEGPVSQEILEFCTTICGFLAIQLKNAVTHQDLEKEANDRSKAENDLDAIFCGSVDMIGIFDRSGLLKRVNPTFQSRFGYSSDELLGRQITSFAHPEDRDYVQYVLDNIEQERIMSGLCHRFINKDKKILFLELNVRYMEESDEIIAIAKDITSQREAEARNIALEQSIALERMKTEFFSNISHEFKTPINIILSSVDLLKLKLKRDNEELYEKQYRRFFTYTEQNSFKLLRLINNLLDCTKIESGALTLLAKNSLIVPFVRQVVETTESYATAHKIDICFETDMAEDMLLFCDPDKVDRILLNLISNSIKHTQEGGIIRVAMTETPTHVQLSVADNGEGIPAKMLPHIFEKFKVYEKGFVKNCDGTGVGLSIVKGLAELHGGSISVRSKRGEGSIFIVTLSKKLKKNMTASEVKMVSQQQDDELHQSRLQMEMSNIE